MFFEILSKPRVFGEGIIVHIRWHIGHLKKTYFGDHQLLKLGCWRLNADVWTGSVQTSAFKCWRLIFEGALPANWYDYTLPVFGVLLSFLVIFFLNSSFDFFSLFLAFFLLKYFTVFLLAFYPLFFCWLLWVSYFYPIFTYTFFSQIFKF